MDLTRRLLASLLGMAMTAAALTAPAAAQSPDQVVAPDCGPASPDGSYEGWPGFGSVSATGDLLPIIVSTQTVAGPPSRFLYSIANPTDQTSLASADVVTQVRFYALARDPATPGEALTGTFIDSGNGLGLYHVTASFDCVGDWGMELAAGLPSGPITTRAIFSVLPYGSVPAIGAPAPRSQTPTATTPEGIAAISTDTDPDPDLYRLGIAEAVGSGRPALIVFSTPQFCTTATCGPTLDIVKAVAADYKDRVDFIHVEPYQLQQTEAGLQPLLDANGGLQVVQAVLDYGLPTEPYQFLVDGSGIVRAQFQGIASADELRAALDEVLGAAG